MRQNRAEKIVHIMAGQFVELRKKKRLSHTQLATRAGITRAAISFIESGKRKPTLLLSLKVAHAMETDLSRLLARAERAFKKRSVSLSLLLLSLSMLRPDGI